MNDIWFPLLGMHGTFVLITGLVVASLTTMHILWHKFDVSAVKLNQPRPRTEGPRFIVSRLAPLDPDLHLRPPCICLSALPCVLSTIPARVSGAPRARLRNFRRSETMDWDWRRAG